MGTMISLPSLEVVEIMTREGFDWLIIDAVHTQGDDLIAQLTIQIDGPGTPCFVRLADKDEGALSKCAHKSPKLVSALGPLRPEILYGALSSCDF